LSGDASWKLGANDWAVYPPGSMIHNLPWSGMACAWIRGSQCWLHLSGRPGQSRNPASLCKTGLENDTAPFGQSDLETRHPSPKDITN